jgi:hypothetical protein
VRIQLPTPPSLAPERRGHRDNEPARVSSTPSRSPTAATPIVPIAGGRAETPDGRGGAAEAPAPRRRRAWDAPAQRARRAPLPLPGQARPRRAACARPPPDARAQRVPDNKAAGGAAGRPRRARRARARAARVSAWQAAAAAMAHPPPPPQLPPGPPGPGPGPGAGPAAPALPPVVCAAAEAAAAGAAPPAGQPAKRRRPQLAERYRIVAACFLATFVAYVERVGFSIAFTEIAKGAGAGESLKGAVLSAFYWGYGVSQVWGLVGGVMRSGWVDRESLGPRGRRAAKGWLGVARSLLRATAAAAAAAERARRRAARIERAGPCRNPAPADPRRLGGAEVRRPRHAVAVLCALVTRVTPDARQVGYAGDG